MKPSKQVKLQITRNVAFHLVRLSFARKRKPEDAISLERQRANCQAICDTNGWISEGYEDLGVHRSGRSEKNRPGWLALMSRLNDLDVVILVTND